MTGQPTDPAAPPANNSRILSLSDGVFAFAMTVMVLTLDVPNVEKVTPAQLPRSVLDQWPQFLSYSITFLVIAQFWNAHHRVFDYIRGHDDILRWLNILFLFCISFLPFPTDLVGDYHNVQFAIVFYDLSMIVTSAALSALWWYASHGRRFVHEHIPPRRVSYMRLRSLIVPAVFLLSIMLSFVNLAAARFAWLLFPLLELAARRAFGSEDVPRPAGERTVASA